MCVSPAETLASDTGDGGSGVMSKICDPSQVVSWDMFRDREVQRRNFCYFGLALSSCPRTVSVPRFGSSSVISAWETVLCQLVCNVYIGTFVSAFTVLCGARTDLPDRHVCCVFWLNMAAAFIQILTAIVMVGWIMSIFWGMDMVILASYRDQGIPQQL
ncbi:protein stum homolog isoform X2 [Anguilla rostrata]|uniref:protein stum homolog isoform X2 n=1 Tax=Anguilla rostrata TaxID=7938 RepID=UPI0030CCCBEF